MRDSLSNIIGAFWSEARTYDGRREFLEWLFRSIPGDSGAAIRRRVLSGYFKSVGDNFLILPGVHFRGSQNLSVGDNVGIGLNNVIQASGGVAIGNNVLLGPGVHIWSMNHRFEDYETPVRVQGYDHKPVTIEDDVWIGAMSFIMPGAHIGKGSVISAGSVLGAKYVEPYSLMAGNPARRIGSRLDRSHGITERPVL
jgi:acetyltransferase-like isoleucine patch superfamily enzyme